jgi:DNA-binding IscR family transcriptional regulator
MLCELAQDKLVISQTGSSGGSRLARKPRQISLLDVYRAVEGPRVFSLHRQDPNHRCPVGVGIGTVLEDVRGEIDSAVEHVLAGITIDDIVTRLKPCPPDRGIRKNGIRVAHAGPTGVATK